MANVTGVEILTMTCALRANAAFWPAVYIMQQWTRPRFEEISVQHTV